MPIWLSGRSPVSEPQVDKLLSAGHADGRLRATMDITEAVRAADMLWICVGTPTRPDGGINLRAVDSAIDEIGEVIKATAARPLVVIRSTVVPRTTRNHIVPRLEAASGQRVDHDIDVVFHPEFLREGVAVEDFNHPSRIVVGEDRVGAGDQLMKLYERYPGPRFSLSSAEAELLKYSDNAFHAAKITFANEIGMLGRLLGIDSRTVAEAFCADTKLNISPKYLKPGFAFGGSCLPKDVRALLRKATELGVEVPLLNSLLESNRNQIESLASRILAHHPTKVGLVGLAFKPATDDMRESPYVTVAKRLIGEGVRVNIYDPEVDPMQLTGSNATAVRAAPPPPGRAAGGRRGTAIWLRRDSRQSSTGSGRDHQRLVGSTSTRV